MNSNNVRQEKETNLKDYINLIRNNVTPIVIITVVSALVAVIYAINAKNIYRSTTVIKLNKQQGNILESPLLPEIQDYGNDRFIANEVEILKSYSIREKVAASLLDSFKYFNNSHQLYQLLAEPEKFGKSFHSPVEKNSLISSLASIVNIEQKRGLDLVEIYAESPSAFEAALIVNVYANEYRQLNLEYNRNQLTMVKTFLAEQKREKFEQLNIAENILKNFQERGGIVSLDQQANSLITQLAQFEAQKNMAKLEITASDNILAKYKEELRKQSPEISTYLEKFASEEYVKNLQTELSKLELNRDIALGDGKNRNADPEVIKNYESKIRSLREKLDKKIETVKASIFATSPDEVKGLSQKIIEEEVKNQSLRVTYNELINIVNQYDKKFQMLPKSTIEFAGLQRNRESLEKLYLLVEEKYQEALINEQSQPGNVYILDKGRIPLKPSKPNRSLIIIIGLVLGIGFAFGYTYVKNYFDDTVKTPEDITHRNINFLAWIPQIEGVEGLASNEFEFIVHKKPDSVASEAFKALRTRIQFAKVEGDEIKTILITSSTASEGKTTITANLAGSLAYTDKKVLLIDCDLRKPRIHNFFNINRYPGLIDYLFDKVSLEEVIRPTQLKNLSIITAGTIPPNPSEMIESKRMKNFLEQMRAKYDYVLVDSAPLIAVTDSEILARLVDATILVVSSNTTEVDLMERSVELLKQDNVSFIGTVLNNFVFKSSYGYYYKYYYYYRKPSEKEKV